MTRRLVELDVDDARCIRCGACSALAPSVFDVAGATCRIEKEPSAADALFAEAARWICPTGAIRARAEGVADDPPAHEDEASLFDALAVGAESVRWPLADVPWEALDPSAAPPELRLVVREMAFSENATYSATQRFLDAFADDVDVSRWMAIWFYEETRHPYVLSEWLRRVGEPLPADFVLKGRVSTPFMRSAVGTLVTNVVSEITAAHAYRHLARTSPEPVLARIASRIAGDEARHAATFFRFARRRLARENERGRLRERARGLEVLHAWLAGAANVTHPVHQMVERLRAAGVSDASAVDLAGVRVRIVRVVGLALGVELRDADDVAPLLRELVTRRRAAGAPDEDDPRA